MREARIADGLADPGAGAAKRLHACKIDPVELRPDKRFQPALLQELPVGFGRNDKAARDADTRTLQVLDHFAERGAFAANERDIAETYVFQGKDDPVIHREYF